MVVAGPGTSKCHPSSCGATKPAQFPVGVKVAAVIGVGVFGSSGTWYGFPSDVVDPVPAVATTAVVTTKATTTAISPPSRHPVKRAVLLNTGSLLGYPALSRPVQHDILSEKSERSSRSRHIVE
jgi:hypothetical protein